jgi:hypothetical protein
MTAQIRIDRNRFEKWTRIQRRENNRPADENSKRIILGVFEIKQALVKAKAI